MSKRTVEAIVRIFSVVLYLVLTLTINVVSMRFRYVNILGGQLEIGRVLSLITVIQILIAIFLTMYGGKRGYPTAVLMLLIHMGIVGMGIYKTGRIGNIPGLFMNVEAIIIITIIHSYAKKLSRIANTDMLTNLTNRRGLMEHVEQLIKRNKRFAFVLIDLDDFKQINDLMGHDQGDVLLQKFADKWDDQAKKAHSCISRLGGDEFVIIMETDHSKADYKQLVIDKILQEDYTADHTYIIGNEEINVSASVGVSFYPDDAENYRDLYRYADMAMYHVKNKGKRNVEVFQDVFANSVSGDYLLEQQVRTALQNESFYAVYQPQFTANTEAIKGAEALARMKDAEGNEISPYHFIPIAERSRLIVDIDFLIFQRALTEFRPVIEKNSDMVLSVNFSVKTIYSKNFIQRLAEILEEKKFPTKNLKVEITESVLISSHGKDKAIEILDQIHQMGIQIALDDFGTGYSSLSYLMDLPIDTLKIDKSFIDRLSENEEDNTYIKAIISMGHILHHDVIAEGIETRTQLELLKGYECDDIQGYLLGKPMPMANLLEEVTPGI